jgi:hypothetical protein
MENLQDSDANAIMEAALSSRTTHSLPRSFEPHELCKIPRFGDCLASTAKELLAITGRLPREARYLSDMQKWLLSQATFAVHFEHATNPENPPISPTNLLNFLKGTPIASKNTTLAFLQETRQYKLIEAVPTSDKRQQLYRAKPETEELIRFWVITHLTALDLVDDGNRVELMNTYPSLLSYVQPIMTREVLHNSDWCRPVASIANFTHAESGNNILHDVASRAPWEFSEDRIWVGNVTSNGISNRYRMSQSNTARILARARDAGLIGWERPANRGACWISATLVNDYRNWQSLKFSAISKAMQMAVTALGINI